jgi:hypothetical protein
MIEITVKDGWYVVTLPKTILVLTKKEFIQALRRGKWWKRHYTRQARMPLSERTSATNRAKVAVRVRRGRVNA